MIKGNSYTLFERLMDLYNCESFWLDNYINKWEISYPTARRDLLFLKERCDINFKYDRYTGKYLRSPKY